MKTIYELTIRSNEYVPGLLTEIITKHNAGQSKVDLDILECYILADKAAYPLFKRNITPIHHTDIGLLNVFEGGGGENTLQYYIEEKIIEELVTNK